MILVTGGTGSVGTRVIEMLLENKQQVRMLARGQSDWRENPMPHFRRVGVDVISGDIRNMDRLSAAITGCEAIIHLAAVMRPTREDTPESVNVDALLNLVALAEPAGVQRFIYVGCLGASQFSHVNYYRTKWQGEQIVRHSNFLWTIFRPSLIFAPGSQLMRALDFWTARLPIVPVVGSGLNRVQPVAADDVAACIVQSLYNKETIGQTYDLVGPHAYNLTELLEMAAVEYGGKRKPLIKVPAKLGYQVADMVGKLNPRSPISEDVMKVLTTDIEGDPKLMTSSFKVRLPSFETSFRRLTG